jgi:Ring finger domain
MSNGNSTYNSDRNEAIRIEIQRLLQSLQESIPLNEEPAPGPNISSPDNMAYLQFLETFSQEYNQNIREYQANMRCVMQILYEMIIQQRPRQRTTQEPVYTLPQTTNRTESYPRNTTSSRSSSRLYQTRRPQTPAQRPVREVSLPTLSQILENLTWRTPTSRFPPTFFRQGRRTTATETEFQDVVVRPTEEQISAAVSRFPYASTMQLRNTNCPITLEPFQEGDPLIQINYCQHSFHEQALENWFQRNVRCPVCRYDIRVSIDSHRTDVSMNTTPLPSAATRLFFRGNVESSSNSHPLAQSFFNDISTEFTNVINDYMNQIQVSLPETASENQVYRFEIPIYYNQYYDGSDNFIGIEPVD